jgi:hypothetical protein
MMQLGGNMLKNIAAARLLGVKLIINEGIESGEIDVGMTVVELSQLIGDVIIEKEKPFEKKLNGLKDDYAY